MESFLLGIFTPIAVWCLAWFAAKGWYSGRPTQVITVNLVTTKEATHEA